MATTWEIGQLWDVPIPLITRKMLTGNAKSLDYFDAVFLYHR